VTRPATAIAKCRQESVTVGSPHQRANSEDVFVFDPLRDARWPELVKRHPASSVFHSTQWLSALRLAYGYESVVYTASPPSTELSSGVVFCKVKSWLTGRRLVSLPFSDHCDPLVENRAEFDELLLPAWESVDSREWDYCELRPIRFQPSASSMLGQPDRYCMHTLDLRPSIDALFQKFHKSSVQRKIRRAEREGLTYEEGNSPRLLGHFYKLLIATRRRQHFPPQPIAWFRSLIASFGEYLKIRVAFKNGNPIASILTLTHNSTVTYKYGCSDARMHPLGGVALLFWKTIQGAKAAGLETLDLGRSDSSNKGLITFKEHWGAIRSPLSYWRYPNRLRGHESSWKKAITEKIVDLAPDQVLATIGGLSYRHIG
jgi:CelD/BcsL family acetyltransferase involved in cellulose biosynthesis